MNISLDDFAGYPCLKLDNGAVSLWLITANGPRIIGFSLPEGRNVLAVIPKITIPTAGGQAYKMRGGHRLWHAPEDPVRTYVADDTPPVIAEMDRGVCATQPVEKLTGIEKQICVTLPDERPRAVVEHRLTNRGIWPVELAPWAITQLKTGGIGVFPQPEAVPSLLPNRRLALWPYTNVRSPHIHWGDRFIFVEATLAEDRLKFGWANPVGWLGYAVDNMLFVKEVVYQPEADYFDFGSSSECYCDQHFIELETLGPRVTLQPGESTTHREVWSLHANVTLETDEERAAELVARLGL